MVEIRNGKEKLITFIKAAVREDVDKLVFEHENLRLQCQQLVNQVKVLAQEQLELVNLVMLRKSVSVFLSGFAVQQQCEFL